MNQLTTKGIDRVDSEGNRDLNAGIAVNEHTKDLIVRGVSDNTLEANRRALKDLGAWMYDAENGSRIDQSLSIDRIRTLSNGGLPRRAWKDSSVGSRSEADWRCW